MGLFNEESLVCQENALPGFKIQQQLCFLARGKHNETLSSAVHRNGRHGVGVGDRHVAELDPRTDHA